AIGPAADVHALGAILYECLTGRPPFQGASVLDTLGLVRFQEAVPPRQLQPKVPKDLETVCLKCLRKEPHQRYASAANLAEAAQRVGVGAPVRARRVGPVERLVKWMRRYPTLAAVYVLLPLVLLLGGGWAAVAWLWQRAVVARNQAEEARGQAEEAGRLAV